MTEKSYKAKVTKTFGEMDKVEKIGLKQLDDALSIEAGILIDIVKFAEISVHNEYVKEGENVDYKVYVFVDADGQKYKTSSESFIRSIEDLVDDMTDEDIPTHVIPVKVCETRSKNNSGSFFTAVLVGGAKHE